MKHVLIFFIHVYQKTISPLLGDCCRFEPSCSHYGEEAIRRFGAIKGGYLTIGRILRCNPRGGHGYDPVPETWEDRPRKHKKG